MPSRLFGVVKLVTGGAVAAGAVAAAFVGGKQGRLGQIGVEVLHKPLNSVCEGGVDLAKSGWREVTGGRSK